MAFGPGKYDKECTAVMDSTHARAVLVVVLNGDRGAGFSVQSRGGPLELATLCDVLELTLGQVRQQLTQAQPAWSPVARAGQAPADPAPAYTCPHCGAQSWNAGDRMHGYCGRCHRYATDSAAA